MRNYSTLIIMLAALLNIQAGPPSKADPTQTILLNRPSTVVEWRDKQGITHRKTVNSKMVFRSVSIIDGANTEDILFVETVDNEPIVTGGEGTNSKVVVEARRCSEGNCKNILWSFTDSSDTCDFFAPSDGNVFYRTTKYGCCGGEDMNYYYDISNGKYLMMCSRNGLDILGNRKASRMAVTYLSAYGYQFSRKFDISKGEIGIVSLYVKDELISQATITSMELDPWTPVVSIAPDKVTLKYVDKQEIVLPISNGQFDIAHIKSSVAVKAVLVPIKSK